MTLEEHDKFSKLFSDILTFSGIQYANEPDGEAYVVYNNAGIVFSITFNKLRNSYVLKNSFFLKSKYKQYGLSADAVPDHQMVFETVAFAYKTQQTVLRAQKDFSVLYKDVLVDSKVTYNMHGDFETYMVTNAGIPGYSIGYDEKTGKYELKKYELINTLYTACGVPDTRVPNYASLYKRTKDYYIAQTVVECMHNFEIY
jgi:hypothetical protein